MILRMNSELHSGLVVFDLDGTLIDSRVQIAGALESAITQAGLESLGGAGPALVGPPLPAMTARALGLPETDPRVIDVVSRFARIYDPLAAQAVVFKGAHEALLALRASGFALALATNKRRAPTLAILRAQGWEDFFGAGVYGAEDFGPRARKWGALEQASERAGHPSFRAMVGDTDADLVACAEARFGRFMLATWGALGWAPPARFEPEIHHPADFPELVALARFWR